MRVCELLPQGIDAALVDDEKNRQYLTGVRSSAGTVVVTREETYLIIDFRYIEMARAAARNCQVLLQDKLCAQIGELFARHGVRSYGVVDSLCSLSKARGWMEKLPAQLVDGSGFEEVLGGLRMQNGRQYAETQVEGIPFEAYTDGSGAHTQVEAKYGFLSSYIEVSFEKHYINPLGTLLARIGVGEKQDYSAKATALITNPTEFIRNVDILWDVGEGLL